MEEEKKDVTVANVESAPVEESKETETVEAVPETEDSEPEIIGGDEGEESEQTQELDNYIDDDVFVDDGEEETEEQEDPQIVQDPVQQEQLQESVPQQTVDPVDTDDLEASLKQRIENEIREDYIPNTKAFRDGVRQEAKEAVMNELGVDEYDPYDDEHQMLFLEKAQQISARRAKAYSLNVERFEQEYKRNKFTNNLQQTMSKIIDTPEKSKALDDALGGMSVNAYRKLQMEIQSGNSNNLIRLARTVVDRMGKGGNPKIVRQNKTAQPAKKEKSDKYVSDFFGW